MAVVRIDFEVNQNGEVSIRKTTAAARELADQTKGTKSVLDSLFAGIGQGVGQKIFGELQSAVKAFAGAVLDASLQLAKVGSHLADLSAKSGASTQSLQKLGFAGSMVGVSLEDISSALPKMQRNLVDGSKAFGQLGLSIGELRKLEPDRQFAEIAATIGQIKDPAEQSAAAMAIFGKSGAELLPLMKSDIAALSAEAVRLGIVLDKDTIDAADNLDDAFTRLDQTWDGFKNQMASIIVQNPDVVKSIELVTNAIAGLSKVIRDNHQWIANFIKSYAHIVDILAGGAVAQLSGLAEKGLKGLAAQAPEWKDEWHRGFTGPTRFRGKGGAGSDAQARKDAAGFAAANNKAMADAIKGEEAYRDAIFNTGKLADKLAKEQEDIQSGRLGLGQKLLAQIREQQRAEDAAAKASQKWADDLIRDQQRHLDLVVQDGDAMRALGDSIGGAFGSGVSLIGSAVEGLRLFDVHAKSSLTTTQKWTAALQGVMSIITNGPAGKGKGAMSGAATGAAVGTSIMPGWGTAIGAVVGGIVGFFSGGAKQRKQEREAAAAAAKQAAEERAARITTGQGRMEGGIVAGIAGLGTPTQAAATAQATLLAGVFWTTFKEKGLLGAVDAFKGIFEQLTASGFDVGTILGPIANVMSAGMNEAFRAATEGAQGLRDMLHGMTEAEIPVTVAQMAALGEEANRAFEMARAGAIEAGLSAADANTAALAAVSPLLQELMVASERYGITLDDNTQALIDQAKAAGLAFPTGPLDKMVTLLEQMVILLGGEIPAAAGRAAGAIGGIVGGVVNAGPVHGGNFAESPDVLAAKGYGPLVVPNMGRGLGPMIQTHAGEGVLIVPRAHVGRMPSVFGAARGFGFSRDTGGDFGGGGGHITFGGGGGPGGTSSSMGDVTFTAGGGGGRRASVEAQEAVQTLTEQVAKLSAAVERAASAQPISITSNPVISVEANPMRVRESAVEAGEFVVNEVIRQMQRRNADLVAEIRSIQREGR